MPKANLPDLKQLSVDKGLFTYPWSTFFSQVFTRIGGSKNYSLGGLLTTDTDAVGNVGSGEDNLISYSLPKKYTWRK